jgi:CheY-like chemotaxis protein
LANADLSEASVADLPHGKYVKVIVRDEGGGIDPKHLERIFDPYFTTKQTGSGLGLATVYSIIKKHGGHIGVVSKVGQGAEFTFYLPASEVQQQLEKTASAVEDLRSIRPTRILVMDDEDMVCALVKRMLEPSGFSVATASGGQEAIELYQQALTAGVRFDAVIMDLTIPGGVGGKEAIRRLLSMDPAARAIVSSGYADDPVMANYAAYGFKGCTAKPYTARELRDILRQVLK